MSLASLLTVLVPTVEELPLETNSSTLLLYFNDEDEPGKGGKTSILFFFFAQTGIQPKRHTRQKFAHAQTLMCKVYAFCLWDVRTYSSHQNFNQPHKAVTLGICQKRTLASLCNIAVKITVWTP